ncbi:MAG TPA: CAP domain-containing protein [Planctomycetota bacterium]|nr:CAP domain-containing protein [Planctomycetota bacterium]
MIATLLFLAAAQQYDHGNPTGDEQLVLEMINRARANPSAEETRLKALYGLPMAWTISEGLPGSAPAVIAKPPLAFNAVLQGIARTHSKDMYDRSFFAHSNPDGKDPFDRMTDAGYPWTNAGENIAVGSPLSFYPADALEDNLMIDAGVAGRGHRRNLLDIYVTGPFREIGLGYWAQSPDNAQGWQAFLTQDFGTTSAGPFLLGVVYYDRNSNSFYDPGEGLGGVVITHTASGTFAITSSSGGYALPVPTSGSTTVTATGITLPGGALVSASTPLGANNVKVDFRVTLAAAPDGDVDGLPNFWETNYPSSATPGSDQDADGFTSLQEFRGGSDPTNNASLPVSQPPAPAPPPGAPPPPPPGGGGSGGGGGGCGALGIGVLLPVLLGAWRRRRR